MLKNILIVISVFISITGLKSQTTISLDSCLKLTEKNHPVARQKANYARISEIKTDILRSNYLPTLSLNAKASYQSETFSLEIDLPPGMNLNLPTPPLDQYSVYAELRQIVWDGGITSSLKETEKLYLKAEDKKNDIELLKLQEQTENIFFSILFYNESEQQLKIVINDLISKRKSIDSAIKNGVLTPDNYDIIDAEILKIEQKMAGIIESRKASIKILNELTSSNFPDSLQLIEPETIAIAEFDGTNNRQELQIFDIQKQIFGSNINTLSKKRMPQFYVFAQGGYGNPGLTMIKDEWSPYFIAGGVISWNLLDKNNTIRNKEILKINTEIIDNEIEIFNKNIASAAFNQLAEIKKLEEYIKRDLKIILLRENISKTAEIKLNNGTITSTEYIGVLTEKHNAIIEYNIHKIQIMKATRNYLRIINK